MKNLLSRMINSLPKRLAASAIVALGVALPVAASAATSVPIEATTGVANVTAGDTTYKSSVTASYDQVVKVEVTYDNDEPAGSGIIAKNMHVKINIPSTAGATQNITTVTSGDNTNTVNGSVTVNTGAANAYLQYIPGTAVWKHAISATSSQTTEQLVSDNVVDSANGLVLENENPCQAGSVTVEARVMTPGVKITKQVELASQTNQWTTSNTANPGDTLKYLISYQNTGNTVENNVIIRDSLPPHMTLVPGTTMLANATYPSGKAVDSNDVVNGGLIVGNYGAGATAYVSFQVKIDGASQLSCGNNEFRNVGVAHPAGMDEYYNTAITMVNNTCTTPPPTTTAPMCDLLTVTKLGGRQIEAKVSDTANGANLESVTYDFGDNSTPLTTDKTDTTYTYAQDGTYAVTAKMLFSVNGKDQTVTSDACTQNVSFTTPSTPATPSTPTTPTQLPNTGAGNVIGLFAGATVVGAIGYRLFLARRLARES